MGNKKKSKGKKKKNMDNSKRNHSDISDSSINSSNSKSPDQKQKPRSTTDDEAAMSLLSMQSAGSGSTGGSSDNTVSNAPRAMMNPGGTQQGQTDPPPSIPDPMIYNDFADNFLISLSRPDIREKLSAVFKDSCVEVINALHQENAALKLSVAANETRIKTLETENTQLKQDLKDAKSDFDDRLNDLEQYDRRNSLRISTPWVESRDENTDAMVHEIAWNCGVNLPPWAIDRSHRVGKPKPNKPRDILVKFTGYRPREAVFNARANLGRSKIYINEDLTAKNSELFYKARCLKKQGKIDSAETRDGRLVVSKFKGDPFKTVKNITELIVVANQNTYAETLNQPRNGQNLLRGAPPQGPRLPAPGQNPNATQFAPRATSTPARGPRPRGPNP